MSKSGSATEPRERKRARINFQRKRSVRSVSVTYGVSLTGSADAPTDALTVNSRADIGRRRQGPGYGGRRPGIPGLLNPDRFLYLSDEIS